MERCALYFDLECSVSTERVTNEQLVTALSALLIIEVKERDVNMDTCIASTSYDECCSIWLEFSKSQTPSPRRNKQRKTKINYACLPTATLTLNMSKM